MKDKIKLNLQLFAEETEETLPTDDKIEDKEEKQEKTFTQDQLDKIIQDRLDRAMKKADEDRKQAEELAKLSEKERAKKELEIKEKELEEERKLFYRERLELQTSKELDKLGLPIAFTEYVMGANAEETQTRITEFTKVWETELEARRIESMKGKTPEIGASKGLTKEEFDKMNYKERTKLYSENPTLYNDLTKQ